MRVLDYQILVKSNQKPQKSEAQTQKKQAKLQQVTQQLSNIKQENRDIKAKLKRKAGKRAGKLGTNVELYRAAKRGTVPPYVKCVLDPFNTDPMRGPADFSQITSLSQKLNLYDFTADSVNNIQLTIFPQNITYTTAPSIDLFHVDQTDSSTGVNIKRFASFMTGLGAAPESTTGNWVSARMIRFGVRIYPIASNFVKQGLLNICRVPGKIEPSTVTPAQIFSSFPSVSQMMQYPSGVEYSLSNITRKGYYEYVWIPLDSHDMNFSAYPGAVQFQAGDSLYRNPIYIRLTGLSAGEKYQIHFLETWEYVPTFAQRAFAPSGTAQANDSDTQSLRDVIKTAPSQSLFDGTVGRMLKAAGPQLAKSMIGSGGRMALAGHIINTGLSFV